MTSLYEEWQRVNEMLLWGERPKSRVANKFGAYTWEPEVTLQATGFDLPAHTDLFVPEERVKLLADRYIEPELWKKCHEIHEKSAGSLSHSFLFDRYTGRVPKAGGCLVGFVISKIDRKHYHVNILSRAAESTMALFGDLYFIRHVLTSLLPFRVDPETVKLNWALGVAQQNRYYAAVYLHQVHGQKFVERWAKSDPVSYWEGLCIPFYNQMVNRDIELTGTPGKWQQRLIKWRTNYEDNGSKAIRVSAFGNRPQHRRTPPIVS